MKIRRVCLIRIHRREVSATAKPNLCGLNMTCVHMDRRDKRRLQMRDDRNTAGPKVRILIRARNLFLNSSENSQTVETLTPTFSNTRPRMTDITPPPPSVLPMAAPSFLLGSRSRGKRAGQVIFNRSERGANPVA